MHPIPYIVSSVLFSAVGVTALVMARKSLIAQAFLPFHQAAAGLKWEEIGGRLQAVLIALLRLAGLGFLVTGIALILVATALLLRPSSLAARVIPLLSLIFCAGLCAINYRLNRATGARTPWKGALYASMMLTAGIILSLIR